MTNSTTTTKNDVRTLIPAYAVREENDAVYLTVEMPGVDKENVDITVQDNQLQVRGHRDVANDRTYHIRERRSGDYFRSFTIDQTVDTDHIDASMTNGVLSLKLSMKESAKPRKIEVKTK
jgi:HSP20 family protein